VVGVEEHLPDAQSDSALVLLGSRPQYDRATAAHIVGGLSRTRKMPCHSWGLPAESCTTGAKLVEIEGSVCHDCYARKGKYTWRNVRRALNRRQGNADHPEWVAAMTMLVQWQALENGQPYFRWFDSGDLQNASMLERIALVARATPAIEHWLPTKEYGMVCDYLTQEELPGNLTLRVSAHMIDHAPPMVEGVLTSTVHRHQVAHGYACPAYEQQPASCGPCRACWNPEIKNVSYPRH
jgi:hypothetical protein